MKEVLFLSLSMLGLQFHGAPKPRNTGEILRGGAGADGNWRRGRRAVCGWEKRRRKLSFQILLCFWLFVDCAFSPPLIFQHMTQYILMSEKTVFSKDAVLEQFLLWANIQFTSYHSSHRSGFVNATEKQRKCPVPCEFESTLSKKKRERMMHKNGF